MGYSQSTVDYERELSIERNREKLKRYEDLLFVACEILHTNDLFHGISSRGKRKELREFYEDKQKSRNEQIEKENKDLVRKKLLNKLTDEERALLREMKNDL